MNFISLFFLLFCVCEKVASQLQPCTDGKDGWYENNGYCYSFVQDQQPRTWADAQAQCETQGANLLSIDSKAENDFVADAFTAQELNKYRSWWIGLRAVGIGSSFKWSDESPFNFNNWRDEVAPYLDSQSSCAVLLTTDYKWMATLCDVVLQSYICKKSNITVNPTDPGDVEGNCLESWYKFENKCYKVYSTDVVDGGGANFDEAQMACSQFNASLASIHNDDEQDLIAAMIGSLNTTAWIGMKKIINFGFHEWIDNSTVDYVNWAPGEPTNSYNDPCVEMYHYNNVAGQWNDVPCSKRLGYVCKMKTDAKLPKPKAVDYKCPENYIRFRQGCFKVETETLDWPSAEKECQKKNGHLATLSDPFDHAFFNLLAKRTQDDVWIGLSDTDRSVNGLFSWVDSWPVYFTKWDRDEPQPEPKFQRCVTLKPNRRFSVKDCSSKLAYICRIRDQTDKKPDTPVVVGSCPPSKRANWIDVGNSYCYHVEYRNVGNWANAAQSCSIIGSGAKLASFHSQHDLDLMRSVISDTETNLYIGLIQDEDGGYVWSDGTPADFVPWEKGEPTKSTREACVEILGHKMKYNNLGCTATLGYICEVKKSVSPTTLPPPTNPPEPVDCGPNYPSWKYFNGSCYFFEQTFIGTKTWYLANDYCNQNGGHLVSIHTQEENDFIYNYIDSIQLFYLHWWIGLNALNGETFEWTDDTPVNFDALPATSENMLLREEKCVATSKLNRDKSWNLELCNRKQSYICKRDYGTVPSSVSPKTTTMADGICPDGWKRAGNKCIKLYGIEADQRANFTSASTVCKNNLPGGNLMSIQNKQEQSIATLLLLDVDVDVWVGMVKEGSQFEYRWIDYSRFSYQNWAPSEPSHGYSDSVCAMMQITRTHPGKWKTSKCQENLAFMCQILPSTSVVTTPSTPDECWTNEPGYVKYGKACYKVNEDKKTWQNAEESCRSAGGHLASISNGLEQNFINYHLQLVQETVDGLWIGLKDDTIKRFKWANGWPVYYTNWNIRHPQSSNYTRCAKIDLNRREWNATDCSEENGYICEITKENPPVIPDEPNSVCPSQVGMWQDFGTDHCYYIESGQPPNKRKPWGDATIFCLQNGAELASIHSQHEIDLLGPHLRESSTEIWIGLLKKNYGQSEFIWHNQSPMNFEAWDNDEPASNDNYNCGALISSTGRWKAKLCSTNLGFVCRIAKVPRNETDVPEPQKPEPQAGLARGAVAGIVIFGLLITVAVVGVIHTYLKRISLDSNLTR